ncbi:MAG: hypothetical protein QM731_14655 [Chitinophagaceae bacterium]
MKAIRLLAMLLLFAGTLTSCNKNSSNPDTPGGTDTSAIAVTVSGGPGVYVSGYDAAKANSNSLPRVATLWKNGKAYKLTDGTFNAGASSVYADSKDVYVAGYETNKDGINVAKLWKNGVLTNLTDGKYDAKASSVFVSNGKVYVAGYESSKLATAGYYSKVAKLWINNVATTLADGSLATSVYVSENDVYVTGSSNDANTMVWKNGVGTALSGSGAQDYPPTSIFVSNRDVYVTGEGYPSNTLQNKWFMQLDSNKTYLTDNLFLFINGSFTYGFPYHIGVIWKNGVADNPVLHQDYSALTYASSVFVNGGDVYIAGGNQQTGVATLWKNGVNTDLTTYPNLSFAYSVFVSGSYVYVAGTGLDAKGKRVATLWKNGVATNLGNSDNDASSINLIGGGTASSVFVVPQ